MHPLDLWLVTILLVGGIVVVCGIGVVAAVLRDGYRRVPDRSPKDRIRGDL
ncbi:hypothetical protein GCM10025867_44440 [Frondihabitans sucicola]|uniref:Uncharacterized protein n=1 Tax=Frondihabitans sucicola TaxID=1268041 RepID=A0ABN6Y8A5_9MICO|nr:hypothetical protein [Frondihabitans sucicola]BDZ52203.1 hypothetical protein GCM10025867_44440 [Frondihabitans sucicola]